MLQNGDGAITRPGLGLVGVFTAHGVLTRRFASGGPLIAALGRGATTQNFGEFGVAQS